jgi:predicted dehydrogenase
LMAGKHVFCQKPLTLTLEENQLIRDACKKYSDQVFFVGTQQRSSRDKFLRAVNMVQKGLLGDISKITVGINGGSVGGPFAKTDPPAGLNWDAWLGQAPMVDYIRERCHGTFRWWYEYSGGKFTDWGAHHVDIATWAIGEDKAGSGPIEIDGSDSSHPVTFKNGYPVKDDQFNTAHDFAVICKFASGIEMNVTSRGDNGILFEGTEGRIFVNRGKLTGKPVEELSSNPLPDGALEKVYNNRSLTGHVANFFEAVAARKEPISDVFSHHRALTTCHLAGIAARVRRKIQWDPKDEQVVGDKLAQSLVARKRRKRFEIEM